MRNPRKPRQTQDVFQCLRYESIQDPERQSTVTVPQMFYLYNVDRTAFKVNKEQKFQNEPHTQSADTQHIFG